jgi:hypothetical protein
MDSDFRTLKAKMALVAEKEAFLQHIDTLNREGMKNMCIELFNYAINLREFTKEQMLQGWATRIMESLEHERD